MEYSDKPDIYSILIIGYSFNVYTRLPLLHLDTQTQLPFQPLTLSTCLEAMPYPTWLWTAPTMSRQPTHFPLLNVSLRLPAIPPLLCQQPQTILHIRTKAIYNLTATSYRH